MSALRRCRPFAGGGTSGRGRWHRRVGVIPLVYLAAIVVIGFVHPFLPQWRWLLIHLLLLGAATNAIVVWSIHFATAVLRVPPAHNRRGETARLVALNVGIGGVLAGGIVGGAWHWVSVAGSVVVTAAVLAHLTVLARQLRRALPAPFTVTVHYYLAASTALLLGVPAGAWMMAVGGGANVRLFHAHINVLGWITLTVLGTLLTLWPTVLRTRMAQDAVRAAEAALPPAVAGLTLLGLGLLLWWPVVVAAGLFLFATAVVVSAVPVIVAARRRPPSSFAAWSIAAALGWLLVALTIDAVSLLGAAGPGPAATDFGGVLVPLLVGFVAQMLIGSLAYLLPTVLGGGPAMVRARTALLERHWSQRVVMANAALVVFVLPVDSYVRIATSMLVLAALVQFLVAAGRALAVDRRS